MAKKDKGKDKRRDWDPWYMGTRVDLPTPKGKFRNLFPEMVPKPKPMRTCNCNCCCCVQSERSAAES